MTELTGPTTQSERILSLDVLRGFAVLGILVMNIQHFSMVGPAYFNPTAYGDLSGLNYVVWLFSHLFFDMKFMSIFSMLFGAGIVLMAERMEESGRRPGRVHYRRTLILLLFGLAHAWLIWTGDILYSYAMCALLVYLFRKKQPKTLIILGVISIAVASIISLGGQFSMEFWPEDQVAAMAKFWSPDQEQVAAELSAYRGGWMAQNEFRFMMAPQMQISGFLFSVSWRAGGLMLVGMGLYKLGVFSASLSDKTYKKMILAAVLLGLPLVLAGVWFRESTDWAMETGFFGGSQFNYWGSLFVALGWVGAMMLFCQSNAGTRLYRSLAATGQMALTNYLTQTLICTTLFYGHGFGLYGHVERTGQFLIVLAVWGVQLLWSPWWLARFRFGPFEWLWRSLTYWRLQPLRR
ncbi:MAG: DUF418 domain-containing protein [Gemmatimonadetes bacterium]|nr:DUF418 domain-containing protein [Gemmatimonadota bacterium]NNM04948.1 DUF418 domain-containing protein [Gemmatimonadota bacterium]